MAKKTINEIKKEIREFTKSLGKKKAPKKAKK